MEYSKITKKAMRYVNKLLIPLEGLYYHQYNHSLDVMERSIYLGEKEGLNKSDLEILALAGLFHDTGFVIKYDNNEFIGAKIAKNFLLTMLYPKDKISKIEDIIMATSPGYKNPKNICEEIIKDADLDNLGRDDFFAKKDLVKIELETIKKIKLKDPEWTHGTLMLLNEHKYFTSTQKKEREPKKIENRKLLQEMLDELQSGDF